MLIGAAAAIACHGDPTALAITALAGAVGALLPDVDSDESEIRQMTNTSRSAGVGGRLFSLLMPSHRGITHSCWAAILLAMAVHWTGQEWAWPVVTGYVSHLLADGLTRQGVPLLWPLRWRLRGPISTGSLMEHLIGTAVSVWGVLKVAPLVMRWS